MAEKRKYEKPSTGVIELQQLTALLSGSFTGNRDNPYGAPIDPWSEQEEGGNDYEEEI